ncbi:CaiB/BaiF CoA transferase family protein [Acuticoccus mangrovi]|uniref:CoA transferase n=1 Tax=Acuticoccus mangrovi TaxID=2796142 RepID=A0A934MM93_9HYPH|nr:CoA transferase [Acuticoccus mangrovi]MBJ3777074.1 CoA transferase [Acuticoccus mangrovi]
MTPLKGVTVLDLGIITAGAATSALLADLGADVIKIESPTYKDPFRIWVSSSPQDRDKLSPHFGATNRGKKALAVNLKEPEGRDCFLRLVARADVVVENFRRGVLDKLGIGFEALKAANPRVVLASISSQGETGPDAMHVSYGSTLECVAGMAWLLGYDDGRPTVSGVDLNYPDQVAAIFAAGMIVSAVHAVENGAEAVHLDLSQRELTSFMIGDSFANPEAVPARGNADPRFALQDCLKAADGRWVALSVREADAVAHPHVGTPTAAAEWIAARPADEAVDALTAAGIAAAVAATGVEILDAKPWSTAMIETPDGAILKGTPFDIGTPHADLVAPVFGGDTVEVLERLGGYSREEIRTLIERGIVAAPETAEAAE